MTVTDLKNVLPNKIYRPNTMRDFINGNGVGGKDIPWGCYIYFGDGIMSSLSSINFFTAGEEISVKVWTKEGDSFYLGDFDLESPEGEVMDYLCFQLKKILWPVVRINENEMEHLRHHATQ